MFGSNNNDSPAIKASGSAPAVMPDNPFSESAAPAVVSPVPEPIVPSPAPAAEPMSSLPTPMAPKVPAAAPDEDLMTLKQQALQNLQPLVSHLDQTPEEKFKTTMMLIQATDNSALVKDAYEAAKQITDEKGRAQALLDVVNEINYFTHKDEK